MKSYNNLLGLIVVSLVTACGGGSDNSSSVSVPANTAPSFVSDGSLTAVEGDLAIASLEVQDLESGYAGVIQSIEGGTDSDLFSITASGDLSFSDAVDFENPADADTDNIYEVTIQASDGDKAATLAVTVTVQDAVEGRVIDAPLSGSSVFIDLDGDSVQDADEPTTTSDADGYFAVKQEEAAAGVTPRIISVGGTDTQTSKELPNLALISQLPSDATKDMAVTPLTTVVSAAATPEAKTKLLAALGISGTVEELITQDTWALAQAGDETAKSLQKKNQQIALILQTADSLIDTDSATKATDLSEAVADQLVSLSASSDSVDLSSSTVVSSVLTDAVTEVDSSVSVSADTISAVSDSVATVSALIADTNLDPTSSAGKEVAEAAQITLQTSVTQLSEGSVDTATFSSETDTNELFEGGTVLEVLVDTDGDGTKDALDADDDGDGVLDTADAFPLDKTETLDTDSDGIGNTKDTDDDGDGVLDTADAFPLDKTETLDTDSDGIGNTKDTDDDGDGVLDTADAFPLDKTETLDTDSDGIGNTKDTDDDGDGVLDTADAFPLDKTETLDTDSDGIGNTKDTDDDGDGVLDTADAFPLDKTETLDTDSDGIGNTKDTDDDGDTYLDTEDRYPLVAGTNIAPIFSSEAACSSVTENVYFVCDLTATDADGDTITFSLSGTDAPDFEVLNGTRLAFKAPANYEKPTDYGTNNKYNLTISMNDGYGAVAKTIIVTVTNVQENLLGEDGFGKLRAE